MKSSNQEVKFNADFEIDELDLDANFQVGAVIRRYLKDGIKRAGHLKGMSRRGIAERMTELLGEPITENMINKYTRKASPYRFPLEYLPAFCKATGDFRLINFVPNLFGMKVLDSLESVKKEIKDIEMVEEQVQQRRKELEARLKEIRGAE